MSTEHDAVVQVAFDDAGDGLLAYMAEHFIGFGVEVRACASDCPHVNLLLKTCGNTNAAGYARSLIDELDEALGDWDGVQPERLSMSVVLTERK